MRLSEPIVQLIGNSRALLTPVLTAHWTKTSIMNLRHKTLHLRLQVSAVGTLVTHKRSIDVYSLEVLPTWSLRPQPYTPDPRLSFWLCPARSKSPRSWPLSTVAGSRLKVLSLLQAEDKPKLNTSPNPSTLNLNRLRIL